MDVNTLYAAIDLGAQEEYDTQIIKDVWNDESTNFQNFTDKDFAGETNMCEAAYEASGADAYSKCRAAALACGADAKCNALAVKYAQALEKGYSKSFADFKKKSGTLAAIGDIASGLLGGLLGSLGKKDNNIEVGGGGVYPAPTKSRTGLYIGVGLVAAVGIGAAIYFATRKK